MEFRKSSLLQVTTCSFPVDPVDFWASDFEKVPPHPERLSGPPSLLSNGYQRLFPRG
jgi:hypothetical protein